MRSRTCIFGFRILENWASSTGNVVFIFLLAQLAVARQPWCTNWPSPSLKGNKSCPSKTLLKSSRRTCSSCSWMRRLGLPMKIWLNFPYVIGQTSWLSEKFGTVRRRVQWLELVWQGRQSFQPFMPRASEVFMSACWSWVWVRKSWQSWCKVSATRD